MLASSPSSHGRSIVGGREEKEIHLDIFSPAHIEAIAKVCDAANAVCCALHGEEPLAWDNGGREASIASVKFLLMHPDAGDSALHKDWTAMKLKDGWSWGSEKDPEQKTHPCLVPFESLPPYQQEKDRIFIGIVRTMTRGWPEACRRRDPRAGKPPHA